MKSITGVAFIVILGISACGDAEKAAENKTDKKEHFLSTQQKALEKAKTVQGVANAATERRQKELDKLK